MENKNEFTQNSAQQKHPAEKLMQYPIGSDSDGVPKSVVRNPELAEELAYAEKPYRESALELESHGMDDEAATILRRGRAAVQRMGVEKQYYNSYDTTREAVKRAIATDDPAWLNPNHASEVRIAKYRARQEAEGREFERDKFILADQRRYVRALDDDKAIQREITDLNSYSGNYRDEESKNFKRIFYNMPESGELSYGEAIFSNENLKKVFLEKRRRAFATLLTANSWRTVAHKESLAKPIRGIDEELNMFFRDVQELYEGGVVDATGAKLVLNQFDNARYSVDDFRAVAGDIRVTFANGSFYDKTTNLGSLLRGLYSEESYEDIHTERAEWVSDQEEKDAEFREQTRAYTKQRSEREKVIKEAREAARQLEIETKFQEVHAAFIAGRDTTKQKILESPVGNEVAPILDIQPSDESYEAVYSSTRALKAALALFTVKRSEEFGEGGHLVPYTKLDIDTLWREKFEKPQGYYGGETGEARLTIRKATGDESEDVERQLKRLDTVGRDEAFVVDITVEGVKNGEAQMTSTLEGILYSVPDVALPLVRVFAYRPLESTSMGDPKQFQLEKLAAISRARRHTAEAMANPLRGGLPGLGRKR